MDVREKEHLENRKDSLIIKQSDISKIKSPVEKLEDRVEKIIQKWSKKEKQIENRICNIQNLKRERRRNKEEEIINRIIK